MGQGEKLHDRMAENMLALQNHGAGEAQEQNVNAPDYRMQQEIEEERMSVELDICKRIAQGLSNEQDALYVASSFGLKTEFLKEQEHEMG